MTATIHIKNSLASETPVTDGKHVWAYFGNVGVACYDVGGQGRLVAQDAAPQDEDGLGHRQLRRRCTRASCSSSTTTRRSRS